MEYTACYIGHGTQESPGDPLLDKEMQNTLIEKAKWLGLLYN
jgi:hypothetical protein